MDLKRLFIILAVLGLGLVLRARLDRYVPPRARDLLAFRQAHPTVLTRHGPPPASWQDPTPLSIPPGVQEVTYESDGLKLKAWMSAIPKDGRVHPAVVFCHGGFWFGDEDWDVLSPLLDAGFVVLAPRVRAENGNPGEFQYYYGEVDDVIAAGRFLAQQKGIDKHRLFVSGHSAGADLAMLAVMMPNPYVMAAPISPALDMRLLVKLTDKPHRQLVVFDSSNQDEITLRCAMLFTASLRCPVVIFHGDRDWGMKLPDQFAALAHHFKRQASVVTVPGNHGQALLNSLPKIVTLFDEFQPQGN